MSNGSKETTVSSQEWLNMVVKHVKSLRYGVVEIVVHDGRVIQIEKTERTRLDKTAPGDSRPRP
jgi:hypothetical protein